MHEGASVGGMAAGWEIRMPDHLDDGGRRAVSGHLGALTALGVEVIPLPLPAEADDGPQVPRLISREDVARFAEEHNLKGGRTAGIRAFSAIWQEQTCRRVRVASEDLTTFEPPEPGPSDLPVVAILHNDDVFIDFPSLERALPEWLQTNFSGVRNLGVSGIHLLGYFVNEMNRQYGVQKDALPVKPRLESIEQKPLTHSFEVEGQAQQLVTHHTMRDFAVGNGIAQRGSTSALQQVFEHLASRLQPDYHKGTTWHAAKRVAPGLFYLETYTTARRVDMTLWGMTPRAFVTAVDQLHPFLSEQQQRSVKWKVATQYAAALREWLEQPQDAAPEPEPRFRTVHPPAGREDEF